MLDINKVGRETRKENGEVTMEGLANLTSSAESLQPIPPPLKSTISTRKTSPSRTSATGGMSGCHRLWSGYFCSHGFFFKSTGTTSLGLLLGGVMAAFPYSLTRMLTKDVTSGSLIFVHREIYSVSSTIREKAF